MLVIINEVNVVLSTLDIIGWLWDNNLGKRQSISLITNFCGYLSRDQVSGCCYFLLTLYVITSITWVLCEDLHCHDVLNGNIFWWYICESIEKFLMRSSRNLLSGFFISSKSTKYEKEGCVRFPVIMWISSWSKSSTFALVFRWRNSALPHFLISHFSSSW